MDDKRKKIIAGAVLGVLALIVIYLNFFSGGGGESIPKDEIKAASQMVEEVQQANPELTGSATKGPPAGRGRPGH